MKKFLLISLFLSVITGLNAQTIKIAGEDDWVPYALSDGTGLSYDVTKAAYASVGVEVVFDVMPFSRVLLYIEKGKYAAGFSVGKHKENKDKYIFGKHPIIKDPISYYYNTDNPLAAKNKEMLNNMVKVGVVNEYTYSDHYNSLVSEGLVSVNESNSDTINVKKLLMKRVDTIILNSKTASYLLKKFDAEHKIKLAFNDATEISYLAFSKKHPKGQYYSDLFDQGMGIILENGTYQKIIDAY